jgi:multidrug efflux pump subunit AcrB
MAAIMLAGIVAYFQLPVSALPQVDYPTIQVLTFYPGASPDVTATTVTAPLERQFGQLQGLSQMTSTSSGGVSVVVLQFVLTLPIDVAEEEVQSAINAAQSLLPANLPTPPIYSKTNPADAPVLTLAITSDTIPLSKVEDLVDTRLAPKISQLSGVGLVSISGGQKPAVRIQANPVALASYGIDLESLRAALTATSVNAAKGNFDGPRQDYQIDSNDQLVTTADYRDVVVAYRNGAPVFVKNVARVADGVENSNQAAWMNNIPAVILNIQRQPGANTIIVVNSIQKLLPQLEANLPAGIQVTKLTDLTTSIQSSVDDVEFEMMLTVGLVVLVIFLFLRSLKATIIPSGGGAAVAGGHVRRDVHARLQPRQPIAHGTDDLHRFCGGRRNRDDREHFALSRRGRQADDGRSQGRGTDRVHDHVADDFAHRRADSASVHGGRSRPALPRICGDAGGHDRDLGGRLADSHADDVGSHFEAHARFPADAASIAGQKMCSTA